MTEAQSFIACVLYLFRQPIFFFTLFLLCASNSTLMTEQQTIESESVGASTLNFHLHTCVLRFEAFYLFC